MQPTAPSPQFAPAQRIVPTATQVAKLRENMGQVRANLRALESMLNVYQPDSPSAQGELQSLYSACCEMQMRVRQLIDQVDDDALVCTLHGAGVLGSRRAYA